MKLDSASIVRIGGRTLSLFPLVARISRCTQPLKWPQMTQIATRSSQICSSRCVHWPPRAPLQPQRLISFVAGGAHGSQDFCTRLRLLPRELSRSATRTELTCACSPHQVFALVSVLLNSPSAPTKKLLRSVNTAYVFHVAKDDGEERSFLVDLKVADAARASRSTLICSLR